MNKLCFRLGAILLLCLWSCPAFCSGWPTGKKKMVWIPSLYQYFASSYRDPQSHMFPYPKGGLYQSTLLQLYGEYGISKRLDIIGALPYYLIRYHDNLTNEPNEGFADLQLGLRYNLVNFHDRSFLSFQATGIAPLYHNDSLRLPFIGFGEDGAEGRLMYSGSRKAGRKDWYFDLEAAYRQYFGSHGGISQESFLGTAGLYLNASNQVSVGLEGIQSAGNNGSFNPININGNTNFNFLKFSLNYGHRLSSTLWAYAGLFHDLYGRNTGIGKGFSVMLIYRSK